MPKGDGAESTAAIAFEAADVDPYDFATQFWVHVVATLFLLLGLGVARYGRKTGLPATSSLSSSANTSGGW